MSTDSKNQKGVSPKLIVVLVLIALVIGIALLLQDKKPAQPPVAATPPPTTPVAEETQGAKRPPAADDGNITAEEVEEPEENAQRAYLVEDFRDTQRDWSKFKLTNITMTAEGLKLADGQTEGTVESPCTALKLPANMVALLWKESLPDGTTVKPAMQLSYDCENWSAWYPIESTGDDINPLYPDGSPNPNYGYVPGSYVSLGLELVPFIRYKFHLTRTDLSKESPTVPGARFYHLDSTLGEGVAVNDVKQFPPGPPTPEEMRIRQELEQKQLNELPNPNDPSEQPNGSDSVPNN